ncbi:glycosyltransferase family 2 protein [Enterococcus mundtii]|uniref:Glycosyl transferase, group 2 family protein n=1 Tax=Enterococcus mundtii TaxID=53346 RepID=A0A242KXM7_ENTMU|nr:glycosyltransferase family 2 protein [Enterococcus mundtii]OTP26705.1 glycosyl transferase, group 2 family protein [Enterococcus mundtii]
MCEISIIVPVYNVEKYLRNCVDSILNQTFKNFELILVDDGSLDDSGKICDEYVKKDKRVRVLHKENGGLSSARNAGIEYAHGRYLGFIDSDDYIEPDMYELLYNNMVHEDADLSICGIYDVYEGKEPIKKTRIKEIVPSDEALLLILQGNIISVHAVNKLYKKELFNNLRYPVGKYHEDSFIIVDLLDNCKKVAIDSTQKYYYVHRLGSINTETFSDKQFDFIEAWEQNEIKLQDKSTAIKEAAHQRVCFANFLVLDKIILGNKLNIPETNQIKNYLKNNFFFIMSNKIFTKSRKFSMILLMISVHLYGIPVKLRREHLTKNKD